MPSDPSTTPGANAARGALSRRALLRGTAAAAGFLLLEGAVPSSIRTAAAAVLPAGPSTTVLPYLLPSRNGVDIKPLLTVRDKPADNGYAMVGIPDGLGIIPAGDKFTLVMNHELTPAVGVARAHGSKGAFVSTWSLDKATQRVLTGADLIKSPSSIYTWDMASKSYKTGTYAFNRFCSADLPAESAFLNGSKGTNVRMFMNGEESEGGRCWAHLVTGPNAGQSWELPRLGRGSWENVVASPQTKDKTVVMVLDDGNLNTAAVAENYPCELLVYIGTKQETGSEIERAGLTNGKLYAVRLPKGAGFIGGESDDFALGDAASGYVASNRFDLVQLGTDGDVSSLGTLEQEQDLIAKNAFRFRRTEDGAWDPRVANKNNFYFVTTASISTNSRLWNLKFDDLDDPLKGGTLTALLKGNEGHRMLDNLTIDALGRIIIQEDPGNDPRIGRVWMYGIESKAFVEVAYHNPLFFEPLFGLPQFLTADEESSGVIDAADVLGAGWFLLDVQAHRVISSTNPDLVEDGQLLAMYVDPAIK